jgi:two-component system OmpR family sensor kinase
VRERRHRRLFWHVYLHGLGLLIAIALALLATHWLLPGQAPWKRAVEGAVSYLGGGADTLPADLEDRAEAVSTLFDVDLTVFAPDGARRIVVGEPLAPPDAEERSDCRRRAFARRDGRPLLVVPLAEGHEAVALVRGEHPFAQWWMVLLIVLAVLAVASVPLARAFARPLERIATTARRWARGDLDARTGLSRHDEVGALAAALDAMAERLQTLRAREQALLADVSHELRTPLARLRVALALSQDDPEGGHLDGMEADLDDLERLVSDLLASARLDLAEADVALRRAPVDVVTLLGEAADRFARRHGEGALSIDVAPDLPALAADAALLRRVLDNLLENGVRHGAPPLRVRAEPCPDGVRFTVADAGPGFPADDLPRVFEPFYRADASRSRETGGVGLGLALCRRVVEAHGGRIEAQNGDRGAAIRFTLPVG